MCPETRKGEVGRSRNDAPAPVLSGASYGKRVFTRQIECTAFIDSGASGGRWAEGCWLRDRRDTVMRLLEGASWGRLMQLVCQATCGLPRQFVAAPVHCTLPRRVKADPSLPSLAIQSSLPTLVTITTGVSRVRFALTCYRSSSHSTQPFRRFTEPPFAQGNVSRFTYITRLGSHSTSFHESRSREHVSSTRHLVSGQGCRSHYPRFSTSQASWFLHGHSHCGLVRQLHHLKVSAVLPIH